MQYWTGTPHFDLISRIPIKKLILYTAIALSAVSIKKVSAQITYLNSVASHNQNAIQMIISPDNRFSYVITHGEIQTYQYNPSNGQLTFQSFLSQMSIGNPFYGLFTLAMSPDSKYIYAQGIDDIYIFSRDSLTGILAPFQTLTDGYYPSVSPMSNNNIAITRNGKNIYVAGGNNLFIYKRNSITGILGLIDIVHNLNSVPFMFSDISILLSSDDRLVFITGGHSVSVHSRDTITGNITFKNIITGTNFVNQGLTYANESAKTANDQFLYTVTNSQGSGALNVLKRDTITDSVSVIQTLYTPIEPRFINVFSEKKLICLSSCFRNDLMFFQIDSTTGKVQYLSTFHDSISYKYNNKKYIDISNKYFFSCPMWTDSIYIFNLDFTLSISSTFEKQGSMTAFPNPFSKYTTFRTDIFLNNITFTADNCFGQTVVQIKNISGQTFTFNRDNLASGLYFVRLTEGNKIIAAGKLVITDK